MDLRESIPIAIAIQWLVGMSLANVAYMRPERIPSWFKRWVPPMPERGSRRAGALALQSLAWLIATPFASLVPLLPIYTVFRWIDAAYRAWEAATGWRGARDRA